MLGVIEDVEIVPQIDRPRDLTYLGEHARKMKLGSILKAIKRDDVPAETACWLVGVDPEDLAGEMLRDPTTRVLVNQALAQAERKLIQSVRQGGKGLDVAKAALAILQSTREGWRKRSNVNLAAQFNDALTELRKRLKGPMTGEQAMAIVFDVFRRHS